MITYYVHGRRRFAAAGAIAGAFLFGCFTIGVLSVRDRTHGVMLVAALACLIVYLSKPQAMAWIALFLSFASLPPGIPPGKVIGPVAIYGHHVPLLLAICYLVPIVRPPRAAYLLPGMFAITVAFFAAAGLAAGHDPTDIAREATFLLEMVAGFMLAQLIVYGSYIKGTIRVIALVLWFSAGMIIASSLHLIRLGGVSYSLEHETGTTEAVRVGTHTATPAMVILTALVAAHIVGRVKLTTSLALAPPALIVSLLAFSRNLLISVVVAAVVAFAATLGWHALRRTATFTAVGAAILAVTVPGALFLLQHSAAGAWLSDQFTAYHNRVLGGVSTHALAVDESTQSRLRENAHLFPKIAEAPVFGHGLGYPYQAPLWKRETFGATYAHNFYLWWLSKAGAAGMTAFALFALAPIIRGLRSGVPAAKISAAVCVGLLMVCIVDPLPEEGANALSLGMALGAAMVFAGLRRRREDASEVDAARTAAPTGVPG